MTASLPMYWRPETASAWQALWAFVQAEIGEGPLTLATPDDLHLHWRDPGLVLSQTCSLPLRMGLSDHVHVLGSFDFDLPDTPAGDYHSVIVGNAKKPNAPKIAVNSLDSQSGWAALLEWRPNLVSAHRSLTGAHIESLRAVATGRADLAAVDGVTWDLVTRFDSDLAQSLTVVARTTATPGLPLITGRADLVPSLRHALSQAIAKLKPEDVTTLGLKAFVPQGADRYLALPLPPSL